MADDDDRSPEELRELQRELDATRNEAYIAEGELMQPITGYTAPRANDDGKVFTVAIQRLDNGYAVSLYDHPGYDRMYKEAEAELNASQEAEVEKVKDLTVDEKIDAMVDGIVSFQRFVMDKSTGDDWKGDEVKEKMREGFKVMFPGLAAQAKRPRRPRLAPRPRSEQRVFESKEALVKWLEGNL